MRKIKLKKNRLKFDNSFNLDGLDWANIGMEDEH